MRKTSRQAGKTQPKAVAARNRANLARQRAIRLAVGRENEQRQVQEALARSPVYGEIRIGSLRERFLGEGSVWTEEDLLFGPGKREVKP